MISRLLLDFAKRYPWLIVLNALVMIFVPINEVWLPHLYGKMISNMTTNKFMNTLYLILFVLAMVQCGYIFRDKITEKTKPLFEGYLKAEILDIILRKHMTSFDTLTTGDIIYKISIIPEVVLQWFQWLNDYMIPYIFVFIVATIYFLSYDIYVAAMFVVFLVLLMTMSFKAPIVCHQEALENDNIFSKMHEQIEEVIHNMQSIYASNKTEDEIQNIYDQTAQYQNAFAATATCSRKFKIAMVPIVTLLVGFFILRSKLLIDSNKVSQESFTSIFMVLTYMMASIFWLVDVMRDSVFDLGKLANVDDMLKEPIPDVRERQLYRPPTEYACGLYNVSFSYKNKTIFENFSVNFERNKCTLISGPIGSGKTTILKLLLAFHVPQRGDAYVDGQWYGELDTSTIRRKIGYVPQHAALFNNTVLYNIKYGNNVSDEEVIEFATKFGLDRSFLEKNVGKNGMHLSGGQRQYVWCLRVMLNDPDIILMDEPTASMDLETKEALFDILSSMMKNRTVIMVTHDPFLVKHADNQVQMK